jgi:hypothetical protein
MIQSRLVSLIAVLDLAEIALNAHLYCFVVNVKKAICPYFLELCVLLILFAMILTARIVQVILLHA